MAESGCAAESEEGDSKPSRWPCKHTCTEEWLGGKYIDMKLFGEKEIAEAIAA